MKKVLLAIVAFALGSASHLCAQGLTLEQAQQNALNNNADVTNAAIDVDIAKKKVWETTAIGLPQVTAEGTYSYQFEVPSMSLGPGAPEVEMGQHSNSSYTVSLSQLIFSGEYIVGLKASKTYKRFAGEQLENAKLDIKEKVANSYFSVLVTKESLRLIDTSLSLLQGSAAEVKAMADAGFAESTEADQMALNVAALKNQRTSIARQGQVAQRVLNYNMGMPLDSAVELSQNLDGLLAVVNASVDTGNVQLDQHVQYKMMKTNQDLMELDWKRNKTHYLPTVAGFYQHKGYVDEPEISFEPKDLVGISVSLPLFTSGQRHSQVQQAKLEYVKAVNTKEQVAEAIMLGIAKAESEYLSALESYQTEQENMDLALRIFKNYLTKQKNGMASSLDVTNVQNQYIQTQTKYVTAMFDVLRLKVALDKAKGTL